MRRGEVFSHFQGKKIVRFKGILWENISPNGKVIIVAFSAWRHRKVFSLLGRPTVCPTLE